MKKRVFITATNTNIGKTYTTKLLLQEYASQGFKVGVLKPIETGVDLIAPDASELYELTCKLNPTFSALHVSDIVPITYKLAAAPYVASNKTPLNLKKIDEAVKKVEQYCDILLIEGAGGLLVPIDEKMDMLSLASYLQAPILLVTHCSLGCINDTLLNLRVLRDYKYGFEFVFNSKESDTDFATISEPYFKDRFSDHFLLSNDLKVLTQKLLTHSL